MHWLTICIISGHSPLMLASFCMLISHALLSTNSFLLVDAIGRRFKTRLVTEINGVNFLCPKLFLVSLVNLLVFLGFPGSIMFVTEILFFGFFFDLFPLLCLILIVLLYLLGPTFFFRSWVNVLFGSSVFFSKTLPIDLTFKELLLYGGLLILMYWLGITWQAFIF
jgi:NADH:ubiquinone oxidoreductase subunit 4 (subunit M)